MQVSIEELEQYSGKNSLAIHGIPEGINVHMAVGVEMAAERIEMSHRLYRKQGIKPTVVKFANHKEKTKLYKARSQLKIVTLSSIYPKLLLLRTKEPMHLY